MTLRVILAEKGTTIYSRGFYERKWRFCSTLATKWAKISRYLQVKLTKLHPMFRVFFSNKPSDPMFRDFFLAKKSPISAAHPCSPVLGEFSRHTPPPPPRDVNPVYNFWYDPYINMQIPSWVDDVIINQPKVSFQFLIFRRVSTWYLFLMIPFIIYPVSHLWDCKWDPLHFKDILRLKTLFNYSWEERFKAIVWTLMSHSCIMMFRKVNKLPGMQNVLKIDAVTIKKSMTEYHHWINVLAAHLYLTQ